MDLGTVAGYLLGGLVIAGVVALAYPLGKLVTRAIIPPDAPLEIRESPPWAIWRARRNQQDIDDAIESLVPEPLRHQGDGEPDQPTRWRA